MFVWVGLMFFVVGAVSCSRGERGAERATGRTGTYRARALRCIINVPSDPPPVCKTRFLTIIFLLAKLMVKGLLYPQRMISKEHASAFNKYL